MTYDDWCGNVWTVEEMDAHAAEMAEETFNEAANLASLEAAGSCEEEDVSEEHDTEPVDYFTRPLRQWSNLDIATMGARLTREVTRRESDNRAEHKEIAAAKKALKPLRSSKQRKDAGKPRQPREVAT